MGRRAVEVLVSAMDLGGEHAAESASQVVVLKAELRIRESTAPPRATTP
jgi:DNA-binding LacI/PurR family transcriptional regulator